MAQFKPAKITSDGQLMMMQDLNNEIDLQFTKIAFGNGEYTAEEYAAITSRTALKSQKQSFNINSMAILSRNSLVLSVVANNSALAEGYSMTEIGLFAKDGSDQNATEKLYAIVAAEDGCADYMPAYNGSSTVRVRQNFQVDVVDASTVTIAVTDSAVVALSYLEELYYNKAQTDVLLEGKMNIAVLDSISTLSALNEIATDTDYANGNYTLLIPIASGNIISNLDVGIAETAIMTFPGDYVMLYFPYNNKTYRYSDTATYKWVRVYADVNPSDSVVAAMISAHHPTPKQAYFSSSISSLNNGQRESAVERQINNNQVGRLYLLGSDFAEYCDLISTQGAVAQVEGGTISSDTYYIQIWHKYNGEIVTRYKIGDDGIYTAWVSTTPAAT